MSGTLSARRKRRRYPVDIDGDTAFIRMLTCGESEQAEKIENLDLRAYYMLGKSLIDDSGELEYQEKDAETPEEYAARVRNGERDLPLDTLQDLMRAVSKINSVDGGKIAKN